MTEYDESDVQGDRVFRDESGNLYSVYSIAMQGMKNGKEIVRVDGGLVIDGEFHEQIAGDPPLDPSDDEGRSS